MRTRSMTFPVLTIFISAGKPNAIEDLLTNPSLTKLKLQLIKQQLPTSVLLPTQKYAQLKPLEMHQKIKQQGSYRAEGCMCLR